MQVLPALAFFALAFFALALAESGQSVAKALQNIASGIPLLGSAIGSLFGKLAQALAWAAGQLYQGIDAMMGAVFHALAWVLEQTFAMYREQAVALLHLSQYAAGQLSGVAGIRGIVQRLEQAWHGIEHGIRTLAREYHGIDQRVTKLEHELARGIGHDLRITVAGLETELTNIEKHVIPGLRQGIKTAEGEVTTLENFIDAIPGTKYLDWAAGVVAAGLGLGLWNLFKCPTFLNKTLGRGCGLWNGLEDIFSLFLDAVLFIDLCAIVPEATALFSEFEAPLVDLISGAANAACAQIPADWAVPMVAAGPLPPAQTLGPLAQG